MFAIAAAFVFALGFILQLLSTDTGKISLIFLGATLLALHFVFPSSPWRRTP